MAFFHYSRIMAKSFGFPELNVAQIIGSIREMCSMELEEKHFSKPDVSCFCCVFLNYIIHNNIFLIIITLTKLQQSCSFEDVLV